MNSALSVESVESVESVDSVKAVSTVLVFPPGVVDGVHEPTLELLAIEAPGKGTKGDRVEGVAAA
jgi:hypothetical protein